jgi:Cytotoxic translational repressor of toxin-antitoxin stability system
LNFEIHLSSRASRFLKTADKELYNRMIKKLYELAEDPFSQDVKRVMGQKEKTFRVRVGDYRILYVAFLDKNTILVVNIDKRKKVYER